jgi:hypothetical protein
MTNSKRKKIRNEKILTIVTAVGGTIAMYFGILVLCA